MMPGMFDAISSLFLAQAAPGNGLDPTIFLMPLGIAFIFYFLIYRPNAEQDKKRRAMIDGMKKNDRVVTAGGVHGVVVSIDPAVGQVVLRIDDEKGVRMKVDRGSIARVLESE